MDQPAVGNTAVLGPVDRNVGRRRGPGAAVGRFDFGEARTTALTFDFTRSSDLPVEVRDGVLVFEANITNLATCSAESGPDRCDLVPVCLVPYGRDQFEVARRVEVARCGTRLPTNKQSPAQLRTKVREAMTMTDGARRVAAGFAATGGVARGADLLAQRVLGLT